MLNLKNSATDKLKVTTSSGADVDVAAHFVDTDSTVTTSSSMVPDRQVTAITTATTTDIVATPASSKTRNVKHISLRNIDASVSQDVTVILDNNGTSYTLLKCTLLAGEELVYNEGIWFHYDAAGGVYSGGLAFAAQADMELATSATLIVSPANQHFHPGHPKFWYRVTVSGNVPTLQQSYNITSITDTATGQLTVTIGNDFSAVNYAIATGVEGASTALTVANRRVDIVRNATPAAGSFIHECADLTATTNLAADPATWYAIAAGDL